MPRGQLAGRFYQQQILAGAELAHGQRQAIGAGAQVGGLLSYGGAQQVHYLQRGLFGAAVGEGDGKLGGGGAGMHREVGQRVAGAGRGQRNQRAQFAFAGGGLGLAENNRRADYVGGREGAAGAGGERVNAHKILAGREGYARGLGAGGRGGYGQAARSRGRGEMRPQNSATSVSWCLPTGCLRVFSSVAPVAAGHPQRLLLPGHKGLSCTFELEMKLKAILLEVCG